MSKTEANSTTTNTDKSEDKLDASGGVRCYPCATEDKVRDACCFCIQCVEYLCEACTSDHRKIKLTRRHRLLEGEEMPNDTKIYEKMAMLMFCSTHTEREVEFMCDVHNKFICSLCIRQSHRNCENLTSLSSIICDKDVSLQEHIERCITFKTSIERKQENASLKLESLQSANDNTDCHLSKVVDELQNLSSYLNNDFRSESKETIDSITVKLSTDVSEYNGFLKCLNDEIVLGNIVQKHGSVAQRRILISTGATSLASIDRNIKLHEHSAHESVKSFQRTITRKLDKIISEITDFKIKQSSTNYFEESDLPNVASLQPDSIASSHQIAKADETSATKGDIPVETSQKAEGIIPVCGTAISVSEQGEKETSTNIDVTIQHIQALPVVVHHRHLYGARVNQTGSYDISIKGQSFRCNHIGSVVFQNGFMMFADAKNKVLKLVSSDFEVCGVITLVSEPIDIALVSDVVAVVENSGIIKIYNVCFTCFNIRPLSYIKPKGIPCSAAALCNCLAILFSNKDRENRDSYIQVFDSNEQIVGEVDDFFGKRDQAIQLRGPYLIRSRADKEFVIAERNRVSIFDRLGNLLWYYKMYDAGPVEDIALDHQGNIYICDTDSNEVYQVNSKSYQHRRTIVSDIDSPTTILFDKSSNSLVIGCANDNLVHVYQFV